LRTTTRRTALPYEKMQCGKGRTLRRFFCPYRRSVSAQDFSFRITVFDVVLGSSIGL
jgi:hypothetical protein